MTAIPPTTDTEPTTATEPTVDMTCPDDPRTWVRSYIATAAVPAMHHTPGALAVVERAQHPDQVAGHEQLIVRLGTLLKPGVVSLERLAGLAMDAARRYEARGVIVDATDLGTLSWQHWQRASDAAGQHGRTLVPVYVPARDRGDLPAHPIGEADPIHRLDLLDALTVAHDRDQGIAYTDDATEARSAIGEYRASTPVRTAVDDEWTPPPTWPVVIATALAIHALETDALETAAAPVDLDACVIGGPRHHWDQARLRDMTAVHDGEDAMTRRVRQVMADSHRRSDAAAVERYPTCRRCGERHPGTGPAGPAGGRW